ncbi:MAG: NrdH-redoxin [Candidatus Diapherotrites archaeon]|uniref:NrdH-redoxin n=1 Tax=Candidatus Iainarchaeum sp. TaxID=3101447 RepID=A0A938YVE6_9ARCH|nr:NrdH-redoxin [Candidatus Diapherotrites archaeon]
MGVIVYSLPNCPKCAASKAVLKRHNVPFEEYDVVQDKEKAREMIEKRRSVRPEGSKEVMMPLLDIEGIILEGFNREKIESALKEKGLLK